MLEDSLLNTCVLLAPAGYSRLVIVDPRELEPVVTSFWKQHPSGVQLSFEDGFYRHIGDFISGLDQIHQSTLWLETQLLSSATVEVRAWHCTRLGLIPCTADTAAQLRDQSLTYYDIDNDLKYCFEDAWYDRLG
jgi:hypothetical protein